MPYTYLEVPITAALPFSTMEGRHFETGYTPSQNQEASVQLSYEPPEDSQNIVNFPVSPMDYLWTPSSVEMDGRVEQFNYSSSVSTSGDSSASQNLPLEFDLSQHHSIDIGMQQECYISNAGEMSVTNLFERELYRGQIQGISQQFQEYAHSGPTVHGDSLRQLYFLPSSQLNDTSSLPSSQHYSASTNIDLDLLGLPVIQYVPQFVNSYEIARASERYIFADRRSSDSQLLTPYRTTSASSEFRVDRPFRCEETGCGWTFVSRKDLERHCLNVHGAGSQYQCRCVYRTRRKDNFRRHVRDVKQCMKSHEDARFVCICGHSELEGHIIVSHIGVCNSKQRGRPSKNRSSPSQM